jgi:YfiH family protein
MMEKPNRHLEVLHSDIIPVKHGFFGKAGGVSKGIYSTLNCGPGSQDDKDLVIKNRSIVAQYLNVPTENLLTLNQIHSNVAVKVDRPWSIDELPEADAMVTDKSGVALGVLTADCAPLLFYSCKNNGDPVVAASHCGWSGARGGIIASTIDMLLDYGAQKSKICASVGPCISMESYQVRTDFYKNFLDESHHNSIFFRKNLDGSMNFNLQAYIKYKLLKLGVKSIHILGVDTYFNEEDYFSFRRSTHRDEPDYGRQISVIAIN